MNFVFFLFLSIHRADNPKLYPLPALPQFWP